MTDSTKTRWERLDDFLASDKEWFACNQEVKKLEKTCKELSGKKYQAEIRYLAACFLCNLAENVDGSDLDDDTCQFTVGMSSFGVGEIAADSLNVAKTLRNKALQDYAKAQREHESAEIAHEAAAEVLQQRRYVLVDQWRDEESAGE